VVFKRQKRGFKPRRNVDVIRFLWFLSGKKEVSRLENRKNSEFYKNRSIFSFVKQYRRKNKREGSRQQKQHLPVAAKATTVVVAERWW
jgi:hypothetical protein